VGFPEHANSLSKFTSPGNLYFMDVPYSPHIPSPLLPLPDFLFFLHNIWTKAIVENRLGPNATVQANLLMSASISNE
jgi:hypothetical protein